MSSGIILRRSKLSMVPFLHIEFIRMQYDKDCPEIMLYP
jgi:hypothetical protein